ncbi:Glycosyltransferase involved in cell wall bisynthesis [Alkalithermobacter thermoalcaliphilus JW-YL-7 = DSM 7308]|uniref:Glycosyl transferase group 1 n=1 Tax=Alkalithermobacter thermoalcaliphilus JW-YL-7 = DSM 7308 TaxID=1121328 RepID=A0A150FSA9_CLOPD|nr:glycosyl transferase group 1 [[Clostridium] paradoxum JW-YL-7 = DSM 7308]SHK72411.1 Glycosyltransferase involved in cell wall bisynthesis [[Clostridium] paradoxum JW-YL-7 = DSM 7308]
MIKVIHVISDTNIGGAGIWLINLLKGIDKGKFLVKVALPKESMLIDYLDDLGIETIKIPGMSDNSFDIKSVKFLYDLFKKEKPYIVHTHASFSARIAAKISGVKKIIYTKHCIDIEEKILIRKKIKSIINKYTSTSVIAVSNAVKENLILSGVCKDNINIVYNGVDEIKQISYEEKQKIRQMFGICEKDIVIGIVARLEKVKGHEYFIKAAAYVLKEYKNVKFLIVGTGSREEELKDLVKQLKIENNIIFTGYIKNVEKIFNIIDINVISSISEALCFSLIEGMSIKKPSIGTDVGGIKEVIKDGYNGYLVPKENPQKLAESMKKLAKDENLRKYMGQNGYEFMKKFFTLDNMVRKVEGIYMNRKILLALMGLNIGGAETHVVELAKGLKKEGFDVIVVSNGGVYEKELKESFIKHYNVPLHNKNPINMIKSYILLKKIIKKEKIDLVHAHARIPGFICGILHKKMNFPFVTTAHWVFTTKYGLKYITNWGQKTIAVSEDIKRYLIDNYNINEKDIKVTINGIDTDKFSSDIDTSDIINEFNLKKDSIKIVYISRLDKDRADVAFDLVDIAKELSCEINNLEIIIVGSGNVFDKLKEKVENINKSLGREVIKLAGARSDVNKFVAIADVFIGVSRSALEAMSAQKCVILAGNEGYIGVLDKQKLDSAIESNFTCRGEKKTDKKVLKKDILDILKDNDKRLQIGLWSRQIIKDMYSVEKMVKDNIDIYTQVLK